MQVFVNGTISGLALALLAIGFSIVYWPARVFHVALGAIYAVVPFIAWTFLAWGWSWQVAYLAAVLAGVVISLSCELLNHGPLERKNASSGVHLVSSLGIYIVLIQIGVMTWGNEAKGLRNGVDSAITVGSLILTRSQWVSALASVAIIAVFFLWLRMGSQGLVFRALADNPVELALRGYNIRRLRLIVFGLSGMFGSLSALLVAFDVGCDANGGLYALLLAVVATIVGGHRSFLGPVLGGVALGILRAEISWIVSSKWADAGTFLLLGVFLLVRKNGIFGRRIIS